MTRIYDKPRPFVMLVDKGMTTEWREAIDLNRIMGLSETGDRGETWVYYDDGTADGKDFNTSMPFDDLYAAWADEQPKPEAGKIVPGGIGPAHDTARSWTVPAETREPVNLDPGSMAIRMQHALDCPIRRDDTNICTCGIEAKKP